MCWLPDIPGLVNHFRHLEKGEDELIHSALLFWGFACSIYAPDEFKERITWWNDLIKKHNSQGQAFEIPEIESLLVLGAENPDKVAGILAKRLDIIIEAQLQRCSSAGANALEPLAVLIFVEAAKLVREVRMGAASENVRITLDILSNRFLQYEKIKNFPGSPQSSIYIQASLAAVGSFLFVTHVSLQYKAGNYEEALQSFVKAVNLIIQSRLLVKDETYHISKDKLGPDGKIPDRELFIFDIKSTVRKAVEPPDNSLFQAYSGDVVFWIQKLTPQYAASCFEALRQGDRLKDASQTVSVLRQFIEFHRHNPLGTWQQTSVIKDYQGCNWQTIDYWNNALGWAEAQIKPSDLRDYFHDTEDNAAERRLRTYFFSDKVWDALSDRARGSLVNADRNLFSGGNARKEAVLNDIKIAVEEIFLIGLWNPLVQWILKTEDRRTQSREFLARVEYLAKMDHAPALPDYKTVLAHSLCKKYFADLGLRPSYVNWLLFLVPPELEKLNALRGISEHKSDNSVSDQINWYYNVFFGVGREGILPKLASILLLTHSK